MVARKQIMAVVLTAFLLIPLQSVANPWNGKVVFQAFWWDVWNESYRNDWYTYLAKLSPRLREMGFDAIYLPPPSKGNSGDNGMGYDIFDHYDLGDKGQKNTTGTRFGSKDSLLRLIAVAHANGLEVYPDIVLNHTSGGQEDPQAPGNKFKYFRYAGFTASDNGRWPKDHWNFHPNPDHWCDTGDQCADMFGPDNCFHDAEYGGGGNGRYMRDKAREWFVWLKKQTGADGFRFDAVKHFPSYVVEDLLFNAMGDRNDYFAVGEYVGSKQEIDSWAQQTRNRAGTFDFSFRRALAGLVEGGGLFDMGSLPDFQQDNRLKTVPFVNNHDTWRGTFWDSDPGSTAHDDRTGDWRQNSSELEPTIDPDNPRAKVAYAAAFAVDGSPMVFYEDFFINSGPDRFRADPATISTRDYLVNLIWAHQKLNFKDGAYKVRYRDSQDLLVIERSGKALIGLNDHGSNWLTAQIQTDFGPHVKLHDYSGANRNDPETDDNGKLTVSVPPMGYAVYGPAGISSGFKSTPKRTAQEFQLDDELGDARPNTPGYGGKIRSTDFRTAGSIWAAAGSTVKLRVYTDGARSVQLRVLKPDKNGAKSTIAGFYSKQGNASNTQPVIMEFKAAREGYHQLSARLSLKKQAATRAYLNVDYEAPAISRKF